jgi:hypothetical protein
MDEVREYSTVYGTSTAGSIHSSYCWASGQTEPSRRKASQASP